MNREKSAMGGPQHYLDLLTDEGFRPTLEGAGDDAMVGFKCEGRKFAFFPDPRDPSFFHLVLSFSVDGEMELLPALQKANANNGNWKIVKTVLDGPEHVSFHFETVTFDDGTSRALLSRAVSALNSAASGFFEQDEPHPTDD